MDDMINIEDWELYRNCKAMGYAWAKLAYVVNKGFLDGINQAISEEK